MNEILKKMASLADNGLLDSDAVAQYQVEATLELAEQVKRIADLLEGYGVQVSDPRWSGELSVLGVSNISQK